MTAGGTDGNERLTVLTGLLLIVLLAVLGVTIVWIGQLLWLHLFLGLLLIGPVVLKLLSTGYRFIRYYAASTDYRRKGPPRRVLRLLGPLVVLSTLAVLATGVGLLLLGPGSRHPLLLLHKASFIAWIAIVVVHVLGHLPEILRYLSGGAAARAAIVPSVLPRAASERYLGRERGWRSLGLAGAGGAFRARGGAGADPSVRCVDTLSIRSARSRSASVGQAPAARRANCSSSGGKGRSSSTG